MLRALLLAGLFALAASAAHAETCTFSTSGDWTSATAFSGTDDCTLSADDDIIIASGATVTITSGSTVTQDGTTASTGVTVQSGGALVMEAGSQLDLNEDGLTCDNGSTCTFAGGYREIGESSPSTQPSIYANTVWQAGDLVLCPGADCGAAQLSYAVADYEIVGGGPGETFIDAAIDAIDTSTDILCWYAAASSKRPPVDEGFCYEIEGASTAGDPYTINFDVRQGTRAQDGYPLARRDLLQTTLGADLAKGERTITLQIGDFPSDDYYNGRMIRFEDGSGNPEDTSYRIMDSEENGASADTITIADINGVSVAKSSGDDVWIDYGWQKGDQFLVIRPVRITSATAAEEDSDIAIDGTVSVEGLVLQGTGRFYLAEDATVSSFGGLWAQDISDAGNDAIRIINTSGGSMERISFTGGSTTAGNDVQHAIVVGPDAGAYTFDMLALRHAGDDFFGVSGSQDSRSNPITITRARCQFSNTNATSQGCLKGTTNGTFGAFRMSATDVEVLDGTRDGDSGLGAEVSGRNAVMIGSIGVFQTLGLGSEAGKFDQLYYVGNAPATGSSEAMMPYNSSGFVVRENVHGASSGGFYRNSTGSGALDVSVKNGLVIENTIDQFGVMDVSGLMENIAFIDNVASSASAAVLLRFAFDAPSSGTILRNLTLVDTPDEWRRGLQIINTVTSSDNFTFDGLAFTRFDQASSHALRDDATGNPGYAASSNLCFFDNLLDSEDEPNLPSDTVRAKPPNFVSPERYRYDVRPGSPWETQDCGVKRSPAPGVCKMNRTLAWSNLGPECMADLGTGGGGGSRSFAPTPFGNP